MQRDWLFTLNTVWLHNGPVPPSQSWQINITSQIQKNTNRNVTSPMTILKTILIRTLKLSQYLKNILISYQKKFGAKMLINNEVTGVFLNPLTTLLSAFLSLCHIIYIRKQTTHFLQNMQSTLRKVLTNN